MTTIHNTSTACCTIPPVQAKYDPKGTTQSFAGFQKVYVTGPEDTGHALVCVYDIFGFYPQTLQGADILAQTLKARVFMPDFFEPHKPYPLENFPPDEKMKAEFQAFFGGPANLDKGVANAKKVGLAVKEAGFARVALYGYCWGGKVATVAGSDTIFDAVSAIHPAMLNAGDAENLKVPIGLFPSKDESADECEKLIKALSSKPFASKNAYKNYSTVHHGFAAARGDLDDPENKKQYEDLYGNLAGFFKGVWS